MLARQLPSKESKTLTRGTPLITPTRSYHMTAVIKSRLMKVRRQVTRSEIEKRCLVPYKTKRPTSRALMSY